MGRSCTTRGGLHFFMKLKNFYVNNLNIYNRSKNGTNLWDDLINRERKIDCTLEIEIAR